MVRRMHLAVALSVSLAVLVSASAFAQAQRPNRQNRERAARVSIAQVPVELLQSICELTPEQASKIKDIQTKLEQELRSLRPERGQPQDPAAAQKRRDLIQQATTEINNVLTPEQKEAIRTAAPELAMLRALNIPFQVIPDLKLTKEQKEKLEQIVKEVREKVAGLSPDERRTKTRELMTEARSKVEAVLTDEQKATLAKFRQQNRQRAGRRQGGAPPSP